MRLSSILVLLVFSVPALKAQDRYAIIGTVLDGHTKKGLSQILVAVEGTQIVKNTDSEGNFKLAVSHSGAYVLSISSPDFVAKRIPVNVESPFLDLGDIYLEKDITMEHSDNLIALTEADISEEESVSVTSGFLKATRDVFLNRAAFDFGQAFFRVRGYGSENGKVLINGIPMNKLLHGRPDWNNWGGLNDVTRNQEYTNGLRSSEHNFGGILGTTNINTRPSGFRPGLRLSASASNRTYTGRLMATYSSGVLGNGLSYTVSASRRWAKEGFIQGTLYDAYSLFGALEYPINNKNSIVLTGIYASNRRGRSAAITEEVYNLVESKYNPYWGNQQGNIRNYKERKIAEPILIFNHFYASDRVQLNTGISYQFGANAKSRLGYYNAPNPDPTYYRYLPSFYLNSPIGASFENAALARDGFLKSPQLNWDNIYVANTTGELKGKAAYVLYDDISDDRQLSLSSVGNIEIEDRLKLDFGITYRSLESRNYAEIDDLLGADFQEDIDPFSNTQNDLMGSLEKREGDIFNYKYNISATELKAFAQLNFSHKRWEAFVSGLFTGTHYQREGLFRNERFMDTSLGKSDKVQFSDYSVKGGIHYKINGRHWITLHGGYLNRPPVLQNVFINPRENNQIVPNIQSEKITLVDVNYLFRLSNLKGRITGFYTRFQNTTDINFFFVDAGVGSDFVQEVLTHLDKLHMGMELGLEYKASPTVKLSLVSAVGKYLYASDPFVTINFDTAGAEEEVLAPEGNIDLGVAKIKDYKLAQGPQKAFSIGVEYRDPKYWWIGATANYLANNYADISTITRTKSFYLDPETGQPFPDATEDNVARLLAQKKMDDFYLLNLVGGKSWLVGGKYISIFASINNVFDAVFRTGGYEQGRNGNYGQMAKDNLSGSPSFAPKYWYGYGRSYFLNFAVSF